MKQKGEEENLIEKKNYFLLFMSFHLKSLYLLITTMLFIVSNFCQDIPCVNRYTCDAVVQDLFKQWQALGGFLLRLL